MRRTGDLRRMLGVAALAMALLLPGAAPAQPADAPPPGRPAGPGQRDPGEFIGRLRDLTMELDLSAQQREQLQAIFQKARQDFAQLREQLAEVDPADRAPQIREFFQNVQQNVNQVLNEQQRTALQRRMAERGGPPGPEGRPGPGGPMGFVEQLRANVGKLDLSDEQKTQVDEVLASSRQRIEALRDAERGEEARRQFGQIMQETRQALGEILTPEQQERLRELMRAAGPPPGERPGPAGERRPQGERRFERERQGPRDGEEVRQRPAREGEQMERRSRPEDREQMERQRPPQRPQRDGQRPPGRSPRTLAPGDPAPDFTARKLDGGSVQLSSYKGEVVVLEFGSFTCPVFRRKVSGMEQLKREMGARAIFLVVYTKEAHPVGGWEVTRNRQENILIEPHADFDARRSVAAEMRKALNISIPMILDDMQDTIMSSYGAGPNSAVVIGRDGAVFAYQQWTDPVSLRSIVEEACAIPRPRPGTAPASSNPS